MRVLLPIVLVLFGLSAGVGAGVAFRPALDSSMVAVETKVESDDALVEDVSYVKLNNQFVVPIIKDEKVSALVVLSLSLEAPATQTAAIYEREPKLRDAFLQVMFDHAYLGGFDGVYTASSAMDTLRQSLLTSARMVADESIAGVLITDIVRQDI